jgi:formamidopyrimidine-DNA glycosylase
MPELPEVETVRRGLAPILTGQYLHGALVRNPRLRWPVPDDLSAKVTGRRIEQITRRAKYLIVTLDLGHLILHLGMSGSLRLVASGIPPEKHDHVDFILADGQVLRYRDPRRFGAILWSEAPTEHALIAPLGIEPLSPEFDGDWLYQASRNIRSPIKSWLMDAHVVVGIGNIYANESLFHAGIHPLRQAGRLSRPHCRRLADAIRDTLERAIEAGGSSLRDFVNGHGQPGYFQQTYSVYGRAGETCRKCNEPIRLTRIGNRASFFCSRCQKK